MVVALSKTYRTPMVDTIQSLPQHQQVTLGTKHGASITRLSCALYLIYCKCYQPHLYLLPLLLTLFLGAYVLICNFAPKLPADCTLLSC